MDPNVTDYLLQELLPVLEDLEAQNAAILSFLKDRGIASDEALKPYLEQAGMASSVKWRAVRARLEHLLAPPPKAATEVGKKEPQTAKEEQAPEAGEEVKPATSGTDEEAKPTQAKSGPDAKAEPKPAEAESAAKLEAEAESKPDEQVKDSEKPLGAEPG